MVHTDSESEQEGLFKVLCLLNPLKHSLLLALTCLGGAPNHLSDRQQTLAVL